MKNDINWNEVPEQTDFEKVVPGGYVCKITSVEDVPEKEYLKIEYDIAEGTFKGYYEGLYKAKAFWGGKFIKSYKETARSFFKAFFTAVEKSNNGYKWDNDETKLKGKLIGLVIGEEEYEKKDKSIGKRLYVDKPRSVDEIRKGNFTIPEFKMFGGGTRPNTPPVGGSNDSFYPIDQSIDDGDDPF